jgi:hypothetical protein
MRICITTDRLPQADRQRGAMLEVTPEKGASLIAQGFAVAVAEIASTTATTAPVDAPVAAPRRVRARAR